ncbi:hypothetical protein [Sporolactobacillus terrae]|uniref:Uncharacterized protein n=1 Tax=Sporolactobacillus terrae TaxID=269673 RepID=A0A5K7X396_9BACL|nr:hypothetical protein [Sporolactobacillus terrae]BBN99170.1 hypothetical protein St703_18750 [Sporolactobacillus terrae]
MIQNQDDLYNKMNEKLKRDLEEVIRQPSLTDRQEQLIEKKQTFRKFVCTR